MKAERRRVCSREWCCGHVYVGSYCRAGASCERRIRAPHPEHICAVPRWAHPWEDVSWAGVRGQRAEWPCRREWFQAGPIGKMVSCIASHSIRVCLLMVLALLLRRYSGYSTEQPVSLDVCVSATFFACTLLTCCPVRVPVVPRDSCTLYRTPG